MKEQYVLKTYPDDYVIRTTLTLEGAKTAALDYDKEISWTDDGFRTHWGFVDSVRKFTIFRFN